MDELRNGLQKAIVGALKASERSLTKLTQQMLMGTRKSLINPTLQIKNACFFLFIFLFALVISARAAEGEGSEGDKAPAKAEKSSEAKASGGSGEGGRIPSSDQRINEGKSLFESNCSRCHEIHSESLGPALKNVTERRSVDWLIPWIHNSRKVIQSGDEYAAKLDEEYSQDMQAFPNLSEEEILSILGYVKAQSKKSPEQAGGGGGSGTEGGDTSAQSSQGGSEYMTTILGIMLLTLIIILLVLVIIISIVKKYLKERETEISEEDKELIDQKYNVLKVLKSKVFIGTVVVIFIAVVLVSGVQGLYSIGVQQGYKPTQPIAFSHKLHAGSLEIECNYCHTGVRKGKNANIPSVNICMNCHNQVKEGPKYGKEQIAEVIDNYEKGRPIEWVRVHNLPDLAYFNHSQHVEAGGVECETCHGPIGEMEVVHQYSTLTMGWCINCHRETEVKAEGNEYYDKILKAHKEEKPDQPLHVEDIGGTECVSCHY